jgi:glycosyltransferase involved in cell wall biosynthesis
MNSSMTFVLCCHNSARRLPETLRHLAAQRAPKGSEWEVVLVDNGSTDGTAEVAQRIWGDGPAALRIVEEPRMGLSSARLAGIAAARYDALTLVDDDNWLAPDWLGVSLEALRAYPRAGAVGGSSIGVCETPTPAWFPAVATHYAVGRQADTSGDVTESRGYLWGAGLVLRRAAWCELLAAGFEFFLDDRTGRRLRSGGDTEICNGLRLRGSRLIYESRLSFCHYLPAGRLRWRYSRRLLRSFGDASVVLTTYHLALRELAGRRVSADEFAWDARMRHARRELFRSPRSLVRALLLAREGALEEHAIDYALGRFFALLRLRRRLDGITTRIRALAAPLMSADR